MKSAAIMASLVDVRNIAAHKCVRLEIHVPAEQCTEVLAAFGWPTMVNPVQVAVARIDPKAAGEPPEAKDGRRAWDSLPAVQQAGIRCGEESFWRFLDRQRAPGVESISSPELAADCIRGRCGVRSRKEFLPNSAAEKRWQFIESAYQSWLASERYSEVAR